MPFNLFSGDPQQQAALALAAGLLESGGPSRMPVSLGQGAARGMMSGREAYMQAQQAQQQQQLFALKMAEVKKQQEADAQRQAALAQMAQDPRFAQLGSLLAVDPKAAIGQAYPEPKVVAPGASLVAPNAPQSPLFTNPAKAAEASPLAKLISERDAIPQGDPRRAAYDAAIAKATTHQSPINLNVQNFTPASQEAQKEFMKSTRTNYEAVRNAPSVLKNIEEAKALIPSAKGFMGPGGESLLEAAKFMNNRLGTSIDTQGVKDAEELRSRVFFQLMENLKKMDAQTSQLQQIMMRDALGKLGTDPNALGAVLDAYGSVVKDKVAIHNKEVASAMERGVKFPYDPVIELRQGRDTPGPKIKKYNPATGRIE